MTLKNIIYFPLTKIILSVLVVAGSVALGEWISRSLLDKIQIQDDFKNLITAIIDVLMALLSYILLFRSYEKRNITELSFESSLKNSVIGFLAGFILQSLLILVIYIAGGYSITRVNPVSFLLPACTTALSAGFVAEIINTWNNISFD